MRWMPERPAVSAAQLSSLPWPSEVTTPMPVTATSGRPCLSRSAIWLLLKRFDQPHGAFAAPMADGGDERLAAPRPRAISAGGERDAARAPALPIVWPTRSPVAWTLPPGARSASAACSSSVIVGDAGRAGDDERRARRHRARPTSLRSAASRRCRAARRERSEATPGDARRAASRRATAACSRDSRTRKQAPDAEDHAAALRRRARRPARYGFFQRKPPIS